MLVRTSIFTVSSHNNGAETFTEDVPDIPSMMDSASFGVDDLNDPSPVDSHTNHYLHGPAERSVSHSSSHGEESSADSSDERSRDDNGAETFTEDKLDLIPDSASFGVDDLNDAWPVDSHTNHHLHGPAEGSVSHLSSHGEELSADSSSKPAAHVCPNT